MTKNAPRVNHGLLWIVALCLLGVNIPAAAASPSGRYVTTTGGPVVTVYDTMTKLTWQQSFYSVANQAAGKTYCAGIPTDQQMTWRLPTTKELLTLVDFSSATAPMIDTSAFPQTPAFPFVTLTVEGGAAPSHGVNFGTGTIGNANSGTLYVRCVFP